MSVSKETLRQMLEEFGGLEMTDAELNAVLPQVQSYTETAAKLRQLDLSKIVSARRLRLEEGGKSNAR